MLIREVFFFCFFCTLFLCCKESEIPKSTIRGDHEEIKAILDKALLSDDPIQSFQEALPRIRKFSSVDSAWVKGLTLYVKYNKGGIVSWSASPNDLTKTKKEQQ